MISISVIIPTYKRPQLLRNALESLTKQSHPSFDVIIVNDSPDYREQYLSIVRDFSSRLNISFLSNTYNQGAPLSRNKGAFFSSSNYIAFLDDDDEWLPDKLQIQYELITKNPLLDFVFSNSFIYSQTSGETCLFNESPVTTFFPEILGRCFVPSPTPLISKRIFLLVNGFDSTFPSCQDWDLWVRIFSKSHHIAYINKPLAVVNKHSSASIGKGQSAYRGYIKFYMKHLFLTLKCKSFTLFGNYLKSIVYFYLIRRWR